MATEDGVLGKTANRSPGTDNYLRPDPAPRTITGEHLEGVRGPRFIAKVCDVV